MIKIYTQLSDGICKSCGGGEVREHYSYKTTPRNLVIAAKKFLAHKKEMVENYGNGGCGRSWLEVDGYNVSDITLKCMLNNDKSDEYYVSPTEQARQLIERICDNEEE